MIELPAPSTGGGMVLAEALRLRRSVREFASEPLRLADAAQLPWTAQGATHPEGPRTAVKHGLRDGEQPWMLLPVGRPR